MIIKTSLAPHIQTDWNQCESAVKAHSSDFYSFAAEPFS